jgi:two-component system nitrate/nitrite response regulator NarL
MLLIIDAGDDLDAAGRQIKLFKERHPAVRIAVLADHNQPLDIVSAFRAGANAFFVKVAPCAAFIKALELVMLGETILPAAVLSTILGRAGNDEEDHEHESAVRELRNMAEKLLEPRNDHRPRLSVRERCILNCLVEGHPNKVIARKIDIAEATVKVHVKAILRKIHVHNRTQAAIWAMSNGSSIAGMDNDASTPAKAAVHLPLTSHLTRTLPVCERKEPALVLPALPSPLKKAARGSRPAG